MTQTQRRFILIKLLINNEEVEYKKWKFPSGELGVQITQYPEVVSWIDVHWNFENNEEIFELLLLSNAIWHKGWRLDTLVIPYLPYSRQDRVCHEGESFSLAVLARLLNSIEVDNIITYDVHSDKAVELVNNLTSVNQRHKAYALPKFDFLIAPDKGAATKASGHFQVKELGTPVVFLTKTRKDGKVLYDDLEYNTISGGVCVVDDICDGGNTFLSLADMLYRTQPNMTKLSLYVTHGLFTAGADQLLHCYDRIFTANLVNSKKLVKEGQVTVI